MSRDLEDFATMLTVDLAHAAEAALVEAVQAAGMPANHRRAYMSGIERGFDASNDTEAVIRLIGDVPNFIEHGLGPGGVGTEGAFDIRQNVLRGRNGQSVPVAPGVFRSMGKNGKPWMHPGFVKRNLLRKVAADLPRIVLAAFAAKAGP